MVKTQFQRKVTINVLLAVLLLSFVGIFAFDKNVDHQQQIFSVTPSVDIKDFDISILAIQEYNTPKGKLFNELSELLKGRYDSPIYSIHRYNLESKLFLILLPFIFIILALSVYNADVKTFIMVVLIYSAFSMFPLFLL